MTKQRVCFRVDSGDHIGFGHLSRCLSLASKFYNNGYEVHILSKNHTGAKTVHDTYKFHVLDGGISRPLSPRDKDNYTSWLGTSQKDDALQTLDFFEKYQRFDYMFIDHYSLDSTYENIVRDRVDKVIVIDDLMNRSHHCDILIDQNVSACLEKYQTLTVCKKFLLGAKYTILSEYFRSGTIIPSVKDSINNILIYLGTIEIRSLYNLVQKLTHSFFHNKNLYILHPKASELTNLIEDLNLNCTLLDYVPDMASFLNEMDFSFGAGGTTAWERCALGIPTATFTVAGNQISGALKLASFGCIDYLGPLDQLDSIKLNKYLDNCLNTPTHWQNISVKCLEMFDVNGINRIWEEIGV